MDFKQIKTKKAQNTLTGLVVSLLIVMAIFFGSYLYVSDNAVSANLTLDSKYSDSYSNLTVARDALEDNVEAIRNNLDNIKEADNTFEVAWNGLKGLGNTLKLPISFLNSALSSWNAITPSLDMLPGWVIPLAFIGILAFVVFLVLKVMKGEPNM